ncbi:MAG: HNH endonuclease, partial [Chloroflexota bacterium]
IKDPKKHDQPISTKSGKPTQNCRFFAAAKEYKSGEREFPELIRVYEKILRGIWVFNGYFHLVDAKEVQQNKRRVFKFELHLTEANNHLTNEPDQKIQLEHSRLIPSSVKRKVWERDNGKCVKCGSDSNLHFDHIIPYSKGGTSLSSKNIQLLCMTCNLAKSDKIE